MHAPCARLLTTEHPGGGVEGESDLSGVHVDDGPQDHSFGHHVAGSVHSARYELHGIVHLQGHVLYFDLQGDDGGKVRIQNTATRGDRH